MDIATLEARLRVLEDREEITRLKAAYCAACDDDHDGDAVAALFVEDGTWTSSFDPVFQGRDEIAGHMFDIRRSGRLRHSTHMVTNPVITVDGDEATATWSFVMMYLGADDAWYRIIGFYHDTHVRRDGRWWFRSLESRIQDYARYPAEPIRRSAPDA